MALRSRGPVSVEQVVYKTSPEVEAKHRAEVEALKRDLDEARRKSALRSAMQASMKPAEVLKTEKESACEAEKAQLLERLNHSLKELSELRRFQQPIKYVDRIVEKVIDRPVEVLVEKFIERRVIDYRKMAMIALLTGLAGVLLGRFLK